MDWTVTKTEGPHKRAVAYACGRVRVSRYTTRGKFPMVRWKAVFDDGREARGMKTAEDAMKYAEDFLT